MGELVAVAAPATAMDLKKLLRDRLFIRTSLTMQSGK
jgi:hypothetical protein